MLGATGFSALEVSVHTYFGIRTYRKFKSKGKTTIYGTGSLSAYTGFLPLGCIMIWQMAAHGLVHSYSIGSDRLKHFLIDKNYDAYLSAVGFSVEEVLKKAILPEDLFARQESSLTAEEYFRFM